MEMRTQGYVLEAERESSIEIAEALREEISIGLVNRMY